MTRCRVVLLRRPQRSLLDWGEYEEANTSTVCRCEDPVVQPIGGWMPLDWVACVICGRPPRDALER